jgi:quinol-cytochrome oxidoreductase complex cytochrome b subunit
MYTFHVILLPLAVVALVVWHVLLVRRHGVVPPYPAKAAKPAPSPPPQATPSEGSAP